MPINLTEEQKQIGTDNFHEAVGHTRRAFLTGTLAATTGLGAAYFGYKSLEGDRVRVGFIGTGKEGGVLLTEHPDQYMEIVAIADLRPTNRKFAKVGEGNENRVGLIEKLGRKVADQITEYESHEELLKDDRVEAVVIAVPLSQHFAVAKAALEAGKHVLSEKLMCHNVKQCKELIKIAAENTDANGNPLLLAVGHQRHYSVLYDNANHLVKQGLLGDIKHIRANWHRNNSWPGRDSWRKPIPPQDAKALEGKVQNYGYDSMEKLVNWRLYNETGGGLMAELGSHQLDACSIFLGKVHPIAVQGYGGRNFYGVKGVGPKEMQADEREIDDHVYVTFEFPGPHYKEDKNDVVIVTYSSINTNAREPYGEVVFGSRGTLMMIQEQEAFLYKESSPSTGKGGFDQRLSVIDKKGDGPVMQASESLAPTASASASSNVMGDKISRGYTEEMEHFCHCIRTNNTAEPNDGGLRCNGTVAMADAIMALTANLAMKKRERIEFQEDWFDPTKLDSFPNWTGKVS